MITTVLFDLDGTLLPMDENAFVKIYIGGLAKTMIPFGYDAEKLAKTIWSGMKAMVVNDGSKTNEQVFWDTYCAVYGQEHREDEKIFADYYKNDYVSTKNACGFNPQVAPMIAKLIARGLKIVIATNPFFPQVATKQRITWAGLNPDDFYYTTYENSRHCKPNLDYYRDILNELNLKPEECIMVGNDVAEDMIASELGIKTFLLTDCLNNKQNLPWEHIPHGDIADLELFLLDNLGK